ncbi:MAG: LytTR family transcriptional regulator [Clostridiales bacterium]|nr:LytTR family transcriptional regulator [Clostridiales bacterium]
MNHNEDRMSEFMTKLNEGKYQETESYLLDLEEEELRDYFVKISSETRNISIYSFVRYMYEKTGERKWLLTAISVARRGLTWLRGGAFVALFHCRQLLEAEPENQPVTALMEELQCIEQTPCKKVKNKDFFYALIQGDYETATRFCTDRNLCGKLVGMACDTDSLCVYSFTRYMYENTGEMKWLEIAETIAEIAMCWMEGGYSVALFHHRERLAREQTYASQKQLQQGNLLKRAAAQDRIYKVWKGLLFFWEIPEKLVDDEEALEIASVVVRKEPQNDLALRVFKRNGRALPDLQLAGESVPKELLTEIMEGKFRRARVFFLDMEEQKRYDMLLKMAYDTRHRSISLFVHDLISAYQENILRNNNIASGRKTESLRVPDRAIDLLCGEYRYDEECFNLVTKIIQEEPGNLSALWIMRQNQRILPDIAIRETEVSEELLREINCGNYHKAAEYLQDFDEEEQNDILVRLQYQVKNGSIFVFLKYLHEETQDPRWDEPGRVVGAIFSAQRASGVHNCKVNKPELPEYDIRVVDRRRKKHPDFIIFEEGMNKEKVDYADLLIIQKEKNSKYVEFCTADQRFRKRISMETAMEEARCHSFVLLNRGQAVNLHHVKSLNRGSIMLDDGTVIPVSKTRLPEISGCLERYWCSEADKRKND